MKKFLVLFAMVAFVGTMASAQAKTCTKSKAACTKSKTACTKSKTATATTVSTKEALPTCSVAAAAKLASLDENIEAKTCSASGKVSYYKKSVCSTSGKVSMKPVQFCSSSKAFVNVAPPSKANTLQVSEKTAKKSCAKSCAKSGKTCSKAKASTATKAEVGTAKQVNLENK